MTRPHIIEEALAFIVAAFIVAAFTVVAITVVYALEWR
jgi:hypothetical protein